jgi:hypothetical protein
MHRRGLVLVDGYLTEVEVQQYYNWSRPLAGELAFED